jgi:hypothetical protein
MRAASLRPSPGRPELSGRHAPTVDRALVPDALTRPQVESIIRGEIANHTVIHP